MVSGASRLDVESCVEERIDRDDSSVSPSHSRAVVLNAKALPAPEPSNRPSSGHQAQNDDSTRLNTCAQLTLCRDFAVSAAGIELATPRV